MRSVISALAAFIALTGCEVQPSDPEGDPILTIQEVTRGGSFPVVFTTDPTLTPARTTCADGSLPPEAAGLFDGPNAWNRYYVLRPDQREVELLMVVRSMSGVSSWIIDVGGPAFAVTDPAVPRLPDGRTVFGFGLGGRFFDRTIRSMTLEIADGVGAEAARERVLTILSTGGGRDLPRDNDTFTLIGAC